MARPRLSRAADGDELGVRFRAGGVHAHAFPWTRYGKQAGVPRMGRHVGGQRDRRTTGKAVVHRQTPLRRDAPAGGGTRASRPSTGLADGFGIGSRRARGARSPREFGSPVPAERWIRPFSAYHTQMGSNGWSVHMYPWANVMRIAEAVARCRRAGEIGPGRCIPGPHTRRSQCLRRCGSRPRPLRSDRYRGPPLQRSRR